MTTFLLPSVAQRPSYRLDQNTDVSTWFWTAFRSHISTNAPDHLRADYTYAGYSSGNTEVAAIPRSLPHMAVDVPPDGIAAEMIVRDTNVTAFGSISLFARKISIYSDYPLAIIGKISIQDLTFSAPTITTSVGTYARATPGAPIGYRMGIEIRPHPTYADQLLVTFRSTDKTETYTTSGYTDISRVVFGMSIKDGASPATVGKTMSIELLTKAADYGLTYTAGVRALDMKTI